MKHNLGAFVLSIGRFVLAAWITALAAIAPGRAQSYDLLLKGGHVIDPANNVYAVLELQKENVGFVDSGHARHMGEQRLRCMMTVRAGKIVFDAEGISWPEWRKAGKYRVVE